MSLSISIYADLIWKNEKGQWHREKGPAVICPEGSAEYHFNNELHRLDGPAMIYSNGYKRYWIHGIEYTKEEYYAKVRKL